MTPSSLDVLPVNRLSEFDTDERREKRFTFREYIQMAEAGILKDNPRTELIRGEIQVMLPIGFPHGVCIMRFNSLLFRHLSLDRWCVISQSTVELDDENAPEPDIVIVKGSHLEHQESFLTKHGCVHVIEVADTSLRRDCGLKVSVYAEQGIPNYWIVNLVDRRIEHFFGPVSVSNLSSFGYEKRLVYGEHDPVRMKFDGEPDLTFTPADILPTPPKT